MLQHAKEHKHHFRKEDLTTLSSEQDWVKRGIKEAIYIKTLNPSINIDPGRHTLSSHFDSILKNAINTPPDPAPHNAETEPMINTVPRHQRKPSKEQTVPKTYTQKSQPEQQLQPQHFARAATTAPATDPATNCHYSSKGICSDRSSNPRNKTITASLSPPTTTAISYRGLALIRAATSGTLNGSSIQPLSFHPSIPNPSLFVSSNSHPTLPYLLSLSSLIPHSRLMKNRVLFKNSRLQFSLVFYTVKYIRYTD